MKKPIVLVIMDGVGRGDGGSGDAVKLAQTPTLDMLLEHYPHTWLKAHGTAVGLPTDDDMGNSEVGHNALGCGQVYSQGAKLVEESIESGKLFQSKTWQDLVSNCLTRDKALHFLGLLSDGNVHSNISHLFAMLKAAKTAGVHRVYCHILLDGRDVPATSALTYVDALEQVLAELREPGFDYAIASGGLAGLGLGNSRQKYLYVPEPQNDFIFSILCEELGFIGAALVVALFLLLLLRGMSIAVRARDKFGALLVVGFVVQVTLQAILNMAVVTNTIPNTGISLPFFSSGGTSLLMLLGEMGIVLSVSRQTDMV